MDERTTGECRSAHKGNFNALRQPSIGWPGTVHPHCRCRVVEPWENGRTLK
jgi:hypothetical protein